jgi:hypothetical protein
VRRFARTNQLHDAKKQKPFRRKAYVKVNLLSWVKQVEGWGFSVYSLQIEINVKMVGLDERDEPANVYAAKPNVNYKTFSWCESKNSSCYFRYS